MNVFFDTHAHLHFPEFAADLTEVLKRAHSAGVEKILAIATSLTSSQQAIALAEKIPSVFAVVGWHPNEALKAPEDFRPALRELAAHPKVVGIGETGLDYYRLPSANGGSPADDDHLKARQADIFRQQLEVAAELKLNCVIHQRASFADTLAQFAPFAGRVRGVFHCFGESLDCLQRVLAAGCLVSFTGNVTFKNAQNVRDAVAAVPADRFMLETDCPFLAPVPYRGQRAEPAHVKEIAVAVASVRQCTLAELSQITCANARQFFPKLGA